MRTTRIVLATAAVAALIWGGWLLASTQRLDQLLNLALWLAAAVVLHDFVLVPVLTFVRRRRRGDASVHGESAPEPPDTTRTA